MKKAAAVLLLLACLAGCAVNQNFVRAVDGPWQMIGPEYIQYVNSDPKLQEDQKKNRKRTAIILTRVIDNAKEDDQ
jgi:hypothetical protein